MIRHRIHPISVNNMYYGVDFTSQPQCTMFGRYKQNKGWNHSGRIIDTDLLIFIISGSATFRFCGYTLSVTSGDWLLIPKKNLYTANTSTYCEFYFFHFHGICDSSSQLPPTSLRAVPKYSLSPLDKTSNTVYLAHKFHSGENLPELMHISSEMHRLMFRTSVGERLLFDQLFGHLLLLLSIEISDTDNVGTPPVLKRAIVYIQENYAQPLTLSVLSTHLQVSKSYLLRSFRIHLGMTVTDYINAVKLDYGAQLLKNRQLNVSQTADYLGYSDSGYFSRLFKKRFGISPSKF